jgi:hypothetical protein
MASFTACALLMLQRPGSEVRITRELFPDIRVAFLANIATHICGGNPNRAEGQQREAQETTS